jgi:hypothetical protein
MPDRGQAISKVSGHDVFFLRMSMPGSGGGGNVTLGSILNSSGSMAVVTTSTVSVKCGLGDGNEVEFVGRSAVPNGSSERSGVVGGSSGGSDGESGAETKSCDLLRMVKTRHRRLFYFNFDLKLNHS